MIDRKYMKITLFCIQTFTQINAKQFIYKLFSNWSSWALSNKRQNLFLIGVAHKLPSKFISKVTQLSYNNKMRLQPRIFYFDYYTNRPYC